MDAEFVRDVVLVVLGALVATGAGWWADIRRELRADRKAERDRKAIAEEADRRRQAGRRDAAQVEALAAAAAMAAPVTNKITDALDEAKTRPHMIQGRWPGIEQQLAAIEREWNHEWRYVIFGAGRIGYHFAELSMLRGQIQEAATAFDEGVDDAYLRDSIERLGESVDQFIEAVQLGRASVGGLACSSFAAGETT